MTIQDLEIGNTENRKRLEKKDITVKDIVWKNIEFKTKKGNKDVLQLYCQHPDAETLIELRKVKFGTTPKDIETLWKDLDKEGKLTKSSAIARMLTHFKLKSINQLLEMKLPTAYTEEEYLVIKAYD